MPFARGVDARDAAGAHVSPHLARLALGPDHACGLHGQRRAQQGHAHMLAQPAFLALVQRRRHAARHQGRGVVVHHGAIENLGRPACLALHGAHAGHGLQHLVVARLGLERPAAAIARDAAIDQPRVERGQLRKADAQPLGNAGPEVVDQHIGLAHQAQQHGMVGLVLQVQHHAPLAAVHAEEGAAFGLQRGGVLAQVVAHGRLDLDDLGALVRQQRAAIGPRDIGAQIQHAHTAQRAFRSLAFTGHKTHSFLLRGKREGLGRLPPKAGFNRPGYCGPWRAASSAPRRCGSPVRTAAASRGWQWRLRAGSWPGWSAWPAPGSRPG